MLSFTTTQHIRSIAHYALYKSTYLLTQIPDCKAHLHPTFINFRWSKNALDRTIARSSKSVPASQLLSNLYWLPINNRISVKIATVTYTVLSTQQPTNVSSLISYCHSNSLLRSSGQSLLNVSRMKTEFGRRAFSSAAPQIWNQTPLAIRTSPSLNYFKRT